MLRHKMARTGLFQRRLIPRSAQFRRQKTQSRVRIKRRRQFARQFDPLARPFNLRIRNWHRRNERLRIGMQRLLIDRIAVRKLHNPPEIKHQYPVRNLTHHAQIMTDEHHRNTEFTLQAMSRSHQWGESIAKRPAPTSISRNRSPRQSLKSLRDAD